MSIVNEYEPDVVTSPWQTVRELQDEYGMTDTELAEHLGWRPVTVRELADGDVPIGEHLADNLAAAFGVSADFWLRRERRYREWRARD